MVAVLIYMVADLFDLLRGKVGNQDGSVTSDNIFDVLLFAIGFYVLVNFVYVYCEYPEIMFGCVFLR